MIGINPDSSPEEQLRRALGLIANSPGLPMPSTAPAAPAAPQGTEVASAAPAAPAAPAISAPGPIATPSAATAINVPRIGDQQLNKDQAELNRVKSTGSGISQIHNGFLRGLARVGDVLGSAFMPGITAMIPGTEFHHNMLVRGDEERVSGDLARQKEQATTQKDTAEAQKAQAEAENTRNPQVKSAFELWHQQNPAGTYADFTKAEQENKPATNPFEMWARQNPTGTFADFQNASKPEDHKSPDDRTYDSFIAQGMTPEQARKKLAEIAPAARSEFVQPPHTIMLLPDGKGNMKAVAVTPGMTIGSGAVTPTQLGSQNTLSSTSKGMAEMAATVNNMVPNLQQQVDSLSSKIGPGQGRWNQFWVNKGGADDPDFAGLDTDLDLFASAVVRTHFGARGGQGYREELRKQFSEAQSPADLKARIEHADKWIQGYANIKPVGAGGGGGANPTAPASPAGGNDPLGILK